MTDLSKKILFPSYVVARDWLFAPSTYLVDSFEPFVEEIYLPFVSTKEGGMKIHYSDYDVCTQRGQSFLKRIKAKFITKREIADNVLLDLRAHSPSNLAHAITIHLPIALYVNKFLGDIKQSKPLLIFPKKLPEHIQQIFTEVGFKFLLTDGQVAGKVCSYTLDSLICLRGALPELIKQSLMNSIFADKLIRQNTQQPRKIFISRRETRRLRNEEEIETFLIKRGYEKVYLEDYSVIAQLSMVSLADSIVAIHGAALGPLVFRTLFNKSEPKLVELFTPAHMSNVYRIVMHQIGGKWVGVRGKVWPKLIEQAYECSPDKVRQYSLLDFEICIESLEQAMESLAL